MASTSAASSSLAFAPQDDDSFDLESLRELVNLINQHMDELLADSKAWKSLKLKCTSKLKIQKQEFFEFSEQSIVSNLYWGIENVEAAIQAKCPEDKDSRLKDSEKMLQAPALLNEHGGTTAGVPNNYLVCCSYFYLSVVRKLQRDDLQVAIHFLQALLVFPTLIRTEFSPRLFTSIVESCCILPVQKEFGTRSRRRSNSSSIEMGSEENAANKAMRLIAKRYKAWLMYYQVMSYGDTSQLHKGSCTVPDDKSQNIMKMKHGSPKSSSSNEHLQRLQYNQNFENVHPFDTQENTTDGMVEVSVASMNMPDLQNQREISLAFLDQVSGGATKSSNRKRLEDILKESQSDTPTSIDSDSSYFAEADSEERGDDFGSSLETIRRVTGNLQQEMFAKKQQGPCSNSNTDTEISMTEAPQDIFYEEANEVNITMLFSGMHSNSLSKLDISNLELGDGELHTWWNCYGREETTLQSYQIFQKDLQGISASRKEVSSYQETADEVILRPEESNLLEQAEILDKVISKLCFSEGLGKCEEVSAVEITTVYQMLANKTGVKYSLLKDVILDQLLMAISTSEEEGVTRASVSILSSIISGNRSVVEDIKKKGLQLCDLASALKRNVYEAAILIYYINPSPAEIKTLELFPILVEIVCNSNCNKSGLKSLIVTPPSASLMIIEVLLTAFDYPTNNMHLAAISSPKVLSSLLNIPRNDNLEEFISLAAILVRCMRFDGQCRKYIIQYTPISPFITLLISNQKRATFVGLEFFNEILRIPRSSALHLLEQIREEGSINIMCVLLLAIQQSQIEYKLLAANLLLQLGVLEDSADKIMYREAAIEALIESLTCEENSSTQQLSAFILSSLGGTFAWTGEPYTIAWLVKKAGLTSQQHKNIIKSFDWSDYALQDNGTDTWCSKIARYFTTLGIPVFEALEKGLKSKNKRVSKDCLTAIAWVGCEIVKSTDDLRCSACEILLSTIEQYVHPGLELEERILACLCIYNYASGRGMQKLTQLSEGVRESLRRLSGITWMADELLKVADYFQPSKWRISCVHTQILEAKHNSNGVVSSLVYYRGQLYSGYADGSIKAWEIKGQTATLVLEIKEHRKAVTCFSLFEPGNCLLSGSADKTIRIWQMIERKLHCIDVIAMKDPIRSLDTCGEQIFAVTHTHKMKVVDASNASRKIKDLCKNKHVKCIWVSQGKVYIGCMDSSIQELTITNERQREIKAPTKSWRLQNRPINSIALYKDWLYCASTSIEGSRVKEWRRQCKAEMSILLEKRTNVLAMSIVEDFIYLNCSSSTNNIEIWLRGTQHKVGRLSAGSKITSLLTANDMILCGTETGLIKGWIPL